MKLNDESFIETNFSLIQPPCSISWKSQLRIFWNYNTVHCSWIWFQRERTLEKHLKMALDLKICVTHYTFSNVLILLRAREGNWSSLYLVVRKFKISFRILEIKQYVQLWRYQELVYKFFIICLGLLTDLKLLHY